jgi:glycine/D-amino acid oxidase-like deaminating enzyme
MINKNEK